jgi:hypothetical protein
MDNEKKQSEIDEVPAENTEIKVDELGDEDLEDASGGSNTGCNCNCGQQ